MNKRVPAWGSKSAEICFIGQSPGKQEQIQQKPFVGPAGQVLRELCVEVGINPEECFFTNVCDRVLLGNDEPTDKDIDEGIPRLNQELHTLKKLKIMVLVGYHAARLSFSGLMREMSGQEGLLFGFPTIAMYHPSATFYAQNKEQIREKIKSVLKKVKILSDLTVITYSELAEICNSDPYKFLDIVRDDGKLRHKTIITPTRRSGIAELLGSKPKPRREDMVAPKRAQSATPDRILVEGEEMHVSIAPPKPDNWLKNIMDETLEKQQVLWEDPVRYFRGSEVGDGCLRSLCLSAMGHRMPVNAKLRRIFNTGPAIEQTNIHTMVKAGLCPNEINYTQVLIGYKDPPIIGHGDVLISCTNFAYLGEIKSINEYAFKKLPKEHGPMLASQSPLFQTHYKYVMQWNCYAGEKTINRVDFNEGFILFEEKNTSKQKFYWLKRDDELLEKMLTRLRLATPYILSNPMRVPPKSINEKDNPEHDWCSRKYLCNAIPDEGATYSEVREIDKELRG